MVLYNGHILMGLDLRHLTLQPDRKCPGHYTARSPWRVQVVIGKSNGDAAAGCPPHSWHG